MLDNLLLFEARYYISELSFPLCQFNLIFRVLDFNFARSRGKLQPQSSDCDLGHNFPSICWTSVLVLLV